MIGKILISPFTSPWKLKTICCQDKAGLTHRIAKAVWQIYQYENNSSIAWNAEFSSEPCFPHGMKSIFISGEAKIGRNCVIFQQVTIGSNTLSDSKGSGAPVIGDNVYIGCGAKIIGSVRIGNNVRIGANAVVYKDVSENSVVVVPEQRVIQKNSTPDNKFYSARRGRKVYFHEGRWLDYNKKKIV